MTEIQKLKFQIFLLDLQEEMFENKPILYGIIIPLFVGLFFGVSAAAGTVAFSFFMFVWNEKKDKAIETLQYAGITAFVVFMLFSGAAFMAAF